MMRSQMTLQLRLWAGAVLVCCVAAGPLAAQTWVEDSYDDFADGRLDASGQNIYVARDGSVRTIHRFDLNQDGHIDLVFNSTHDRYAVIPATLATVGADGKVSHQPLAVEGSRQVAFDDLNKDGYLDAVFCPNAGNVQDKRRFVTIIWGGDDGWPAHRANGALPVFGARSLALADLNGDTWQDIVVLNGPAWQPGQPAGDILRVYWGGQRGFQVTRRQDLGVSRAIELASGDFDGDRADDLAVLTSGGQVVMLWSGPVPSGAEIARTSVPLPAGGAACLAAADQNGDGLLDLIAGTNQGQVLIVHGAAGKSWADSVKVPGANASHISVGDLDGDAWADLVLTDFTTSRAGGGEAAGAGLSTAGEILVLWGDGKDFATGGRMRIPVRYAKAAAIGDLNADGRPDLAVAVHQGAKTMTTDSAIFFGQGKRQFTPGQSPLETTGAAHVAIAPAEKHLPTRAVFCNSLGGTIREEVPVQIYWGAAEGFSPQNVWNIPFASGYESTAADLNRDGYVDFITLNSGHAGEVAKLSPYLGVNIFWGGADGFDIDRRRTVLREEQLGTSNVADLNRDGYLDLVLGQFAPATGNDHQQLIVYYGDERGFDRSRRAAIPSPGRSIGTLIADFNRDRWLDVAVSCFDTDLVRVFWGGPDGLDARRQSTTDVHAAIDAETADLNGDGHLDLIVGSYNDRLSGRHDMGTTILWGATSGFRPSNAQWLPGFTPIGHCVADFDGDGFLDIFSPHYHANGTRESLPAYLYWGSADGFNTRRRTSFICDSSDDALAADFDRDGKLDLAVVCHSRDDTHVTESKIFYNDGKRFANPKVTTLPTRGPHWMWQEDMGHIYHRRWEQTYESSSFRWNRSAEGARLALKADVPQGTTLALAVRSAAEQAELERQPWRPVRPGRLALGRQDRLLQYRATFQSDNGDRFPVLDRIEITLDAD